MSAADATRKTYLFGYPIAHTLSPLVHTSVFERLGLPWNYNLLESRDVDHFVKLLRQADCTGSAVTMPHKVIIGQYLDELTETGREVGACNTVYIREQMGHRKLVGTNTDVVGVREAFLQNVKDPSSMLYDRPALVIGGGGAARSAIYALQKWLKCSHIYIVNRDAEEISTILSSLQGFNMRVAVTRVATVAEAERIDDIGAIVACIPDFIPQTAQEHQARQVTEVLLRKPRKGAMLEMAYHPKVWTGLADLAYSLGWQVILGTEAMIWQGLEQDNLWTGQPIDRMPIAEVKAAVLARLNAAGLPEGYIRTV